MWTKYNYVYWCEYCVRLLAVATAFFSSVLRFRFSFWILMTFTSKTKNRNAIGRKSVKKRHIQSHFLIFPNKKPKSIHFHLSIKKKQKSFRFSIELPFLGDSLDKMASKPHTHTYVYWHRIVKWIGRRSLETKSAPRKLINECCFSQTTTTHTNQQQKQEKISEKIWILYLCVSFFIKFTTFSDFSLYFCVCARFNLIKIFVRKISILNKNKYQK